jgi:hypothetical protein
MMMDAIFERFVAGTPITVMAQLGFERVLDPAWLDEVFDEYRGRHTGNRYGTCRSTTTASYFFA